MEDTSELSEAVVELMRALEDERGRLGLVLLAVEVVDDNGSVVLVRCSDKRSWVQDAFMDQVSDAIAMTDESRRSDG